MFGFDLLSADGIVRAIKGYKPSPKKAGTKQFDKLSAGIGKLPAKVDLRPHMTRVEDQGDTNSCAANATAGAYEYLIKRHQGQHKDVSRLYIYYNGRYMDDADSIEDEGATLHSIIEGLKEYGACEEASWEFDPDYVNEEPDESAYEEGSSFVVQSVRQVPTDLASWKTALASGYPIIFALMLFDSFDKQRKPGLVPPPSKKEASRESHGGHAMLCVGYSDPDKVFIVRNSWGKEWGDKGYCYIPYDYVMNPEHNFDDSWIIERLDELPPDEESWSDDEESVLEEVSSVIANMSDEEWQELLDGMGDHPFERRLALIFLAAVSAGGKASDEEIEVVKHYLQEVLDQIGGNRNAEGLLKYARKHVEDEELLTESMDRIWEHFDYDTLASITNQIEECASTDGISRAERKFIDELIAYWQDGDEEEEAEEEAV
ncbi:MAG: C1 family peptidase, partial [Candidatus Sericytochromatia bacterium]